MKYIFAGKNIEVTKALRDTAMKKVGKLEKFFQKDTEAHITMGVQKARQIVEVTITYNGIVFRAEVSNGDMYASIDKAVDILERQIKRNKTRLQKRLHMVALDDTTNFVSDNIDIEEDEINIVRTKRFAIKPMRVDEAVLQMNLIGHEFFMFYNSETKQANVVYKRRDGDYGLIEPEF